MVSCSTTHRHFSRFYVKNGVAIMVPSDTSWNFNMSRSRCAIVGRILNELVDCEKKSKNTTQQIEEEQTMRDKLSNQKTPTSASSQIGRTTSNFAIQP